MHHTAQRHCDSEHNADRPELEGERGLKKHLGGVKGLKKKIKRVCARDI